MARKRKSVAVDPVIAAIPRTQEQVIAALRREVKLFYDFQRLRMQVDGRTKHKARDDEEMASVEEIPEAKKGESTDIILHPTDQANLLARADELSTVEKSTLKDIDALLDQVPFWRDVLGNRASYPNFFGIGPTMGGVMLSQIDIRRANSISGLMQYCGLATVHGWRCKACHEYVCDAALVGAIVPGEHRAIQKMQGEVRHPAPKFPECALRGTMLNVSQLYLSGRKQHPERNVKLPYNAFVKTKLLGVLAGVMIKMGVERRCGACAERVTRISAKQTGYISEEEVRYKHGEKSPCVATSRAIPEDATRLWVSHYRQIYDDRKVRRVQQQWGKSDAHRHADASRYMIKMLMQDIWRLWRAYEKLPVRESYQEGVLGHKHHDD